MHLYLVDFDISLLMITVAAPLCLELAPRFRNVFIIPLAQSFTGG